jgi:transposase
MRGLTLTTREQTRLQILNEVLERRWSVGEATQILGVSERHTWRLLAAYRKEGAAALAHGNRDRRPTNATPVTMQAHVVAMTRAQELAAAFVEAIEAVIKTVEALTEEQWRLKTSAEGWPAGVVAHHIAARSGILGLEGIVSGNPSLLHMDLSNIDAWNAREAREFADCTKEETLDLLRHISSRVEQLVAGLTDDQLKARGEVLARGPVTTDQWIVVMMLTHVRSHHESIIQTVS